MVTTLNCWNCGKKFEQFREEHPFKNTCKACIIRQEGKAYYNKLIGQKDIFQYIQIGDESQDESKYIKA